jgi:hypothetical protein
MHDYITKYEFLKIKQVKRTAIGEKSTPKMTKQKSNIQALPLSTTKPLLIIHPNRTNLLFG